MDNNIKKFDKVTFDKIIELINVAKSNVTTYVNSELVLLYWNIGRTIRTEILNEGRAEYGERIFDNLSKDLVAEYGRGYSNVNLRRMVAFYDYFLDSQIVATVS